MPDKLGRAADAIGKLADSSGRRIRWRVDKSVPGLVCATACEQIFVYGLSWPAVALAFVGILPLLRASD